MVTPTWGLNIIFFIIFFSIFYFIFDSSLDNFILHIADKDTNVNIGQNATVNINDGNLNLSVMGKVAAAISATGGATAGVQVAKYVAGPPAVKLAAGVATAGAVQLTTSFMSKVLDSNNNGRSNLIANLTQSSNGGTLNDYPLNLLYEINGLLICALVFLYIILNIYISKYLISKDLIRYIPMQNYKIGKLLVIWLNKYLNLWSKSSNYLLGYSYLLLLLILIICKFGLYLILSN